MRRATNIQRTVIWGVAAILVAAAFLLASAPRILADQAPGMPTPPVIDTSADVDPLQCAPCHLTLGTVNKPGLIFGHGNHLMVSCNGCHARMPHKNGRTEPVPMEVCFACHGVQHGPQGELATSACSKCHTKSFNLRPKNHTKDYAKKPHADASNALGVNGCMMCHEAPKDCDSCHQKIKLGIGKIPNTYQSLVTDRPKDPSTKMYPTGPTNMAQCVYCHPDLDAITPGRLIFAHAAHLQRDYACTACHPKFGHTANGPARPDMLSCYRCHGLDHAAQGRVAGDECGKCHPKNFKLMPKDHTKAFTGGKHKTIANRDPAYCAMCHKPAFCVECHQGQSSYPGAPKKPVVPADHRKADWKVKHGRLYLERKGACGSCHDSVMCQRCHKTVMPHPTGWIENHKPEAGVTAADCNVCHTDRSSCQKCHHQSVAKAELTLRNCVKCHPEMKTKNPAKLKNKGFAEHAVHFNVDTRRLGKPYKGRPYTCDDCHIGFTTLSGSASKAAASSGTLPNAGHDVRLCYGCHGAVNYKNELVAPYAGAALCRRCHSELNI